MGLQVRTDWLTELGLDLPENADDMYQVLKTFQEKKNLETPFITTNSFLKMAVQHGIITAPFGLVKGDYYVKDGKVHYGYSENEYKDVLTFLNKLYAEGLLDPNFASCDSATQRAAFMNGQAGMTLDTVSSGLGGALSTMAGTGFDAEGFGPLTRADGSRSYSTHYDNAVTGMMAIVTQQCKNKEAAFQFLNYAYTEEGQILFNWGIEGESYDLVDGKPVVSRLITENPDGLTVQQVSALYNRAWQDGSFVQLKERQTQVIGTSQQLTTMDRWIDSDASLYQMPPVTVAEEDISEYSKLMSEINTYVSEMMVKYISGLESLDTFEEYQATLKKMGVDRAIELQQAAYDSFNGQ